MTLITCNTSDQTVFTRQSKLLEHNHIKQATFILTVILTVGPGCAYIEYKASRSFRP